MNTKRTGELPMITRLVLVGLVAALGVTLPSRPDSDRWMGSAQSWACRVLADWDTWKPRESDAYCLPSESHVTVSDRGRLARVQRIAGETLKSSDRQRSATVTLWAADEEVTRSQQMEGKNAGWAPVHSSDHIELAMIVELYRIAEETRVELQKATPQPDSDPVSQPGAQHASVQSSTMQALPNEVFAPEQPRNEIETVKVLTLPAEVFAPEQPRDPSGPCPSAGAPRVEPQTVMVQNLPTQVFAPGEPRAEVQTANVEALPNDVFAPADQGSDQPGGLVHAHELLGQRVASTSQPAAPGVEPIEEIGPLDPDLDIFCAIASRLIPDSEQVPPESLNAVTNSSAQPEFTPIELGPELDQGIEYELNRGAEGNEIVPDMVAMTSTYLNPSPSTDVGPPAPSTASTGSTPETAPIERANPRIVPNDAGLSPPPELDQAVRLTRDALRAWAHVFTGPGHWKVTTR